MRLRSEVAVPHRSFFIVAYLVAVGALFSVFNGGPPLARWATAQTAAARHAHAAQAAAPEAAAPDTQAH